MSIPEHIKTLLGFDCMHGNIPRIEETLRLNKIDLRSMWHSSFNPIFCAYEHNQLEVLQYLFQKGAVIKGGLRSMLKLSSQVNVEVLTCLLDHVCKTPKSLEKCLDTAINEDQELVVELVIKKEEYIVRYTKVNYQVFCYMIRKNNIQGVKILLEKCQNLKRLENCGKTQFKFLEVAAKKNSLEIVKMLLSKQPEASIGNGGAQPLIYAIDNGNITLVKLLLDSGADAKSEGQHSFLTTPLTQACFLGKIEVVNLFLKCGIDGSDFRSDLNTAFSPLEYACKQYFMHKNLDLIELLLKNNASIHSFDKFKAQTWGNISSRHELLHLLIQYGANVNAQNFYDGRTILHHAVSSGYIESVKILLEYNVNVNLRDHQGRSAYHFAANTFHDGTLKLLFRHQMVDVNMHKDRGGNNLFQVFYQRNLIDGHGNCKVANVLLHYGGDISLEYGMRGRPVQLLLWCQEPKEFCPIINFFDKAFLLGYKISHENFKILSEYNYKRDDVKAFNLYGKELEELKQIVIGTYRKITLYDLLLMKRNAMAAYSANATLLELFEDHDKDFENQFPHFGLLLNIKIRLGAERKIMMDTAIDLLEKLIACRLPEICSEHIFSHMNKNDLNIFNDLEI